MVQYAGRDAMYAGVITHTQIVIKSTRGMHHFPEYTTSPGFTLMKRDKVSRTSSAVNMLAKLTAGMVR